MVAFYKNGYYVMFVRKENNFNKKLILFHLKN